MRGMWAGLLSGRLLAVAVALSAPATVSAQSIRDCETFEANARNVDFSQSPQVFAEGAISLIALDTEEPTCCSWHLMVLHPAGQGDPWQACTLISREGSFGWVGLDLRSSRASYDPARGLTVEVPARIYLPESGFQNGTMLEVTINQSTGSVTVDQRLGGE